MFFRPQHGCALFVACVMVCSAKETVCFKSGFCLDADSHTQTADVVVLRVGSGSLEFPVQDVARIQPLPNISTDENQVKTLPQITTQDALSEAARSAGLPEALVRSVAQAESGFEQKAVSPRGAIGLMQLMPRTAATLGVDPNLAVENARGGAMYLRSLLLRYHGNSALALAAYNAGPGAVEHFGSVPPYEETRRYVVKVLKEYGRLRAVSEPRPSGSGFRGNDTAHGQFTNTPSATN